MDIKSLLGSRKALKRFKIDEARLLDVKEASPSSRDPKKVKIKIATPKVGGGAAGQFEESPVNLQEIGSAYYSDAYISRAVNKIVGLMFKSGWDFTSLNSDALEYIVTRFKLMEESVGESTESLLREIGLNYVLYGNAPILKVRGDKNLAGIKAAGHLSKKPIAALFAAPPERIEVERDENGNVSKYNIQDETGGGVEVKPEDFLLMTYQRPTGRPFGVPYITNVIDDVLILRQIEENIARLIYRNIFPLQTYTVGMAEEGFQATEAELEEVREMIQDAPLDSIVIMPERHKLESVSNNNAALDAYNYLRYFRQRVFTGLGVSESTMGIGDSSNRSTSDNQSSDLIDLVKDFQQNFETEFQKVVNELLFEGGYDPTLNKEDRVNFRFTEIEQAAKIARENHEIQMFMQNAISIDTLWNNIGDEPEQDLSRFYFNLVKGEAESNGTVDNKDKPENQHGKQDAPNKDSLKDARDSSKTSKSGNSVLTEHNLMVNLSVDNVEIASITDSLETSWRKAKIHILANEKEFKENRSKLSTILSEAFTVFPFSSLQEKEHFISILESSVWWKLSHTKEADLDASFYLYENSVLACYTHFLSNKEGGGIE